MISTLSSYPGPCQTKSVSTQYRLAGSVGGNPQGSRL